MDTNFINTPTGRKFLEWTMPELVNQLDKINRNLEKLIALENCCEEEPVKPVGKMNKEIKDGIENIINIRKDLT